MPDAAIPFDKWTMSYALDKRILTTPRISKGRYSIACQKVLAYCEEWVIEENGEERSYEIIDFVREAYPVAKEYEWSISPE